MKPAVKCIIDNRLTKNVSTLQDIDNEMMKFSLRKIGFKIKWLCDWRPPAKALDVIVSHSIFTCEIHFSWIQITIYFNCRTNFTISLYSQISKTFLEAKLKPKEFCCRKQRKNYFILHKPNRIRTNYESKQTYHGKETERKWDKATDFISNDVQFDKKKHNTRCEVKCRKHLPSYTKPTSFE